MAIKLVKLFACSFLAVTIVFVSLNSKNAFASVTGTKNVYLISKTGEETKVATLQFTKSDAGSSYKIEYDYTKFSEHFLSMRPFKCLEIKSEMICHLAYPYKSRRNIKANDLQDIEYDFLYIRKAAGEYGIDFWNGIYYKINQKPNGTFEGVLMETDMDILASPPKDYTRPITHDALNENEDGKHHFPKMIIK